MVYHLQPGSYPTLHVCHRSSRGAPWTWWHPCRGEVSWKWGCWVLCFKISSAPRDSGWARNWKPVWINSRTCQIPGILTRHWNNHTGATQVAWCDVTHVPCRVDLPVDGPFQMWLSQDQPGRTLLCSFTWFLTSRVSSLILSFSFRHFFPRVALLRVVCT